MLNGIQDKQWQLKGEVTSRARPQDSLLEEFLQFDHTTRQAPIINAQTTEKMEALVKQRIKDKAFDDVERKVKPVEMQYEYKKQVALDQEKSKVGLSQIYEEEFMKQQQAAQNGDNQKGLENEGKPNPKHDEIRKQLRNLFVKLDALSNFHFTPKAVRKLFIFVYIYFSNSFSLFFFVVFSQLPKLMSSPICRQFKWKKSHLLMFPTAICWLPKKYEYRFFLIVSVFFCE